MPIIFNGKEFAAKREEKLKRKVKKLKKAGIKPKLVSILVGNDSGSILYTNLKKKAAVRVGVEFIIYGSTGSSLSNLTEVKRIISDANKDETVNGIMVQLPLPKDLRLETKDILETIDPSKDVDGLRENSLYVPATVKAVLQIIEQAFIELNIQNREQFVKKVVVVGAKGMVGKPLVKLLKQLDYPVVGVDKNTKNLRLNTEVADILISATGNPGLIKEDMIKEDAIVIDVGSPNGDVDPEAYKGKAGFVTPVPGGVGPVTIASLLDNLIIAAK